MVYVGGIVVLMLFGIMLSNRSMFSILAEQKDEAQLFPVNILSGTLLSLVVLGGLLTVIWMENIGEINWIKDSIANNKAYSGTENSAHFLGVSFMTTYLLPLETISVYLLAVLVGAAYLARRRSIR